MWHFRRVVGDSMYPTLKEGQIIVVSHNRSYSIGDIVIAHMNGREVVKRVLKMKDGNVFLVGDNKEHSTDSEQHGWLVDRHVVGKVIFLKK